MKKLLIAVLAILTLLATGCSIGEVENQSSNLKQSISSKNAESKRILIAYFSQGENESLPENVDAITSASIQYWKGDLTGNTGAMARMIQEYIGGDLFSIRTKNLYPDNYDETAPIGKDEKNRNIRPDLITHLQSVDDYDVVFLGFPTWWYDMPMAIYSFLDEYDLSGKTIILFATSSGYGFMNTAESVRQMENTEVYEGLALEAKEVMQSEQRVHHWLEEIGFTKKN